MTCIAAVRGFLVDRYVVHRHVMCVVIRTHLDTRFFPVRGFDRYVVHRHVMCVLIRSYLDTRFSYVPTLTPPSGVLAKKKNLRGKQTWLASPMIDATIVLVYE